MSHMRDGATAEELKTYADRKRGELVVRLKGNYDDVLADYEDVQKSYRADDFLALMLSRCVCGYFKTRLDGSYEQKNGTCPRCQSQMREV
jgi:predicted Zn-ribbon and HTH transcriptional regulator